MSPHPDMANSSRKCASCVPPPGQSAVSQQPQQQTEQYYTVPALSLHNNECVPIGQMYFCVHKSV